MSQQTFSQLNEPVGQRAAAGLARLSIALRHEAWQRSFAQDLTPTQGQVLVFLRRQPGSTLNELAEVLAVRASTASEAVQTLVGKGLVSKDRDPTDRRRKRLRLTSRGKEQADDAAQWPDVLARVVDDLEDGEQAVLLRLLQRLIRELQLRGEIPAAQMCSTCRYFQPYVHDDDRSPHHCAFVDLPFGDRDLRLDCPDHETAPVEQLAKVAASLRSTSAGSR